MKKVIMTFALAAVAAAGGFAQSPQPTPAENSALTANRALGDVTEIDAAGKIIVLKVDKVEHAVAAALSDATQYFRAKPEALARAEAGKITPADLDKIAMTDVGVGDRVVILGRTSDDRKAVVARIVIVAKKADIAGKQERDRAEWQRRGTLGVVSAVNPQTKEITISTRTPAGTTPVIIEAAGERVSFRRYPEGSVKYADAQPGSFADVRVGDQLRALGNKSADGARFTPEIVAFGSFRTILGTVKSVDAANNRIQIANEQNKAQTFTVSLAPDTSLRRMSPMMGMMLARLAGGGGAAMGGGRMGGGRMGGRGGQPGAGGGGQPQGGETRRPPEGGAGGGEGQGAGRRGMMGGGGGGGFDLQEMIERLPAAQLAELKPGDVLIVSSTVGQDPTRMTAITILAGAEQILLALQSGPARPGGRGGADISSGLPAGLDLGIGIP